MLPTINIKQEKFTSIKIAPNMKISETLQTIATRIHQAGGIPVLVGGTVRDLLWNIESKDIDVEVFELPLEKLLPVLSELGKVSVVGQSFGVIKVRINGEEFDFSVTENISATSFDEAANRRDFTINAMGIDLMTGEVLDPSNGTLDLMEKTLRVVNPDTFIEDPLRVLRGVQFSARFGLSLPEDTINLFRSLLDELVELPKERVFGELKKLLLKAEKPSIGLQVAKDVGVIRKLFPELHHLQGVPQDPKWHPEGDVWNHTLLVVDEAAKLKCGDEFQDLCLMLAALCHDFGKPVTIKRINERWIFHGHAEAGEELAKGFLERITNEKEVLAKVVALVGKHLHPMTLFHSEQQQKVGNGAIRRLSMKVDIPLLVKLAEADHFGRGEEVTRGTRFEAGEWLLKRSEMLNMDNTLKPEPILQGRHLIKLGMEPGETFGNILKQVYELQLDDRITCLEEALEWVKNNLAFPGGQAVFTGD